MVEDSSAKVALSVASWSNVIEFCASQGYIAPYAGSSAGPALAWQWRAGSESYYVVCNWANTGPTGPTGISQIAHSFNTSGPGTRISSHWWCVTTWLAGVFSLLRGVCTPSGCRCWSFDGWLVTIPVLCPALLPGTHLQSYSCNLPGSDTHYTVTVTTKKTIINCKDIFTFLYLHYMIKNMIFPFVLLVVWILSKRLRLSVSWSEHAQCAEQEQEVWLVIRVGEVDVEEEERYLVYFKVRSNLKSNNNVKFLKQSTAETNRWNMYLYDDEPMIQDFIANLLHINWKLMRNRKNVQALIRILDSLYWKAHHHKLYDVWIIFNKKSGFMQYPAMSIV